MAKIIRIYFIGLLGLILAGCSAEGTLYNTSYNYLPPASVSGKMCILQCQQAKNSCERACHANNGDCEAQIRKQARYNYSEYVAKRRAMGKPIKKQVDDFYDASVCNENRPCGCDKDYQACYELCGGQISATKRCTIFCDHKGRS